MVKEVKSKDVEGDIKLLKAMPYKGNMIYIRMIGVSMFLFDVVFENQLHSSYNIISPEKGKKKLTDNEITRAAAYTFAGATTTIDYLLGEELTEEQKAKVETFEKAGAEIFKPD